MAATVLPLYSARGSPQPRRGGSPIRLKERWLLGACLLVLAVLAYSAFLLLPSDDVAPSALREAIAHPRQLLIPPPRDAQSGIHRHLGDPLADPHLAADADSLRNRIQMAQIPEPRLPQTSSTTSLEGRQQPDGHLPAVNASRTNERREKVKDMMRLAWGSYRKYAWGANELRPLSKSGHSASIFGSSPIGATIIDAVDTLWLMDLKEEYKEARDWIAASFDIGNIRGDLSVFETNIRFLGGLLSIYALTKEEMFKTKAKSVGDMLLPAFETPTGIPFALVNARTKSAKNWGWASAGASILSEFGSLHLEFHYLADITGDRVYFDKVQRIREVLNSIDKPDGLYPNYLNPRTGKWGSKHVSVGALGDSFYEYLIKSFVATAEDDAEAKAMYDLAVDAIEKQLKQTSRNGLVYIAEMRGSRLDHKMDHLACFIVGMFAMSSQREKEESRKARFLQLARDLAHTCHESYIRSATGIGPESFRFTNEFEAKAINDRDKYYILRPEVIEGWFYMWRITREEKYRDWCWEALEAIEKHCRTPDGYSGIRNVYDVDSAKDDVQQSFFLAETLKYLYLTFADDVLPLDQWVLNTEAHPLPVRHSQFRSPSPKG